RRTRRRALAGVMPGMGSDSGRSPCTPTRSFVLQLRFPPGPSQPPPVTASLSMPPPNPSDPQQRPWHTLGSAADRRHAPSGPVSGQRVKVSVLTRGTWFALCALIGGVAVVALRYDRHVYPVTSRRA